MSAQDNGGPAFPLPLGTMNCAEPNESGGMTLRDYFAAKAMQASIGTAGAPWMSPDKHLSNSVAAMAYQMADAMLMERAK